MITGIEQVLDKNLCTGGTIGLLTNHTGVMASGMPNWKALRSSGCNLKAIFGPEHGFRGEAQDVVPVDDNTMQGIAIHSLFGNRLAPTSTMLAGLDMILVDIQDIGCRYYTYIYTLAHMMAACGQAGVPIMVADRPNPIGMFGVCGKQLPDRFSSFVGGYGLPVMHGLTIGEFAQYLQNGYYPETDLEVIPIQGYSRGMSWHNLGLPWISPSPNIPSVETVCVYPGTCLFEGTNVSEGRGTTRPFEIIGAPWIDGEQLREHMAIYDLPGVVFTSQYFTPTFSKFNGQSCQGVCVHVIDTSVFLPLHTGIALLHAINKLYPSHFEWKPDWDHKEQFFIDKLLGSPKTVAMLGSSLPLEDILAEIIITEPAYRELRERIGLYHDV